VATKIIRFLNEEQKTAEELKAAGNYTNPTLFMSLCGVSNIASRTTNFPTCFNTNPVFAKTQCGSR